MGTSKFNKSASIGYIAQYLQAMQVKHTLNETLEGKVVDIHLPD